MQGVHSVIVAYLPRYRGKDATMKECPKLLDFGHSCVTASTNGYAVKDAVMKASTNGYPVKDAVMNETINGNPVKVSCFTEGFTRFLMNTKKRSLAQNAVLQ